MAQTVENAEAVVVTAPKEKVVTPVTVKDVENISEKVAKEVVKASVVVPEFQYKRVDVTPNTTEDAVQFKNLPLIELTKDFYLHDKEKGHWIWCHHYHQLTSGSAATPTYEISALAGDNTEVVDECELGNDYGDTESNYICFVIRAGSIFNDDYSDSWELIYVPQFTFGYKIS